MMVLSFFLENNLTNNEDVLGILKKGLEAILPKLDKESQNNVTLLKNNLDNAIAKVKNNHNTKNIKEIENLCADVARELTNRKNAASLTLTKEQSEHLTNFLLPTKKMQQCII